MRLIPSPKIRTMPGRGVISVETIRGNTVFKSWGHDPIWYFPCLCVQWTLSFASSELYSNQSKYENPCMRSLKTSSSEPKIFLSIFRSLYQLFRVIKDHGPKNQPPSSGIGAPPPHHVFSKDAIMVQFANISYSL